MEFVPSGTITLYPLSNADLTVASMQKFVCSPTINSCFGNRELAKYLEDEKEDTLMIVGLQTNFCIDATVKSAFERGYKVIVPEGTNSTFDNEYMDKKTTYDYYNKMMWPRRFAVCVSMEEAISILQK